MKILISPSKTQKFNGQEYSSFSCPVFLEKSNLLIETLKNYSRDDLVALLKTSKKLTDLSLQRINDFQLPFTAGNSSPALFTFQGDAFEAIATEGYAGPELEHAQAHLFILSGLYGLLRPLDLMQPYRLEMAAKLSVKTNTSLYQFWQKEINEKINASFIGDTDQVLVNLASAEYSRVVNKKELMGNWVDIVFRQQKDGVLKTIAIYAKRARGTMIHYMITNHIAHAIDLQGFDLDGYRFEPAVSNDTVWVFIKKLQA